MLLIAVFAVTARQTTSDNKKIEFLNTLPHFYDIALLCYLTGNS